jgi:hypothetical protein
VNIKNITFDKVIMKSKTRAFIAYHATVSLCSFDDPSMGGAVVIDGYSDLNNIGPRSHSYVFAGWEVVALHDRGFWFKCRGAKEDSLEDFEVECIYSLPLMDTK